MNFRKNYTEIDIIAVQPNFPKAPSGEAGPFEKQVGGIVRLHDANDEGTLVFVEVKTRISDAYGKPFEAITHSKITNLIRTAQLYAKMHPHLPRSMRIDAIGVTMDKDGRIEEIEHVENISGF
jgi:Holliday junction resolvase-like predicted endonuclease